MFVSFCSFSCRMTMKAAKWGPAANLPDVWRLASRPEARIQVVGAGLACCSLEVEAAAAMGLLVRWDEEVDEGAAAGTVVVVAGTITDVLEPAVERLYAQSAQCGPVTVLAFGACATSGGPYWDAPTVTNGLGSIPVESYVPGCPPRPQALVAELERLVDAMATA